MKWIRKYPFVGMLAMMIAGILLSFRWPETSRWVMVCGAIVAVVSLISGWALRCRREVWWMIATGGLLMAFGSWHTAYEWEKSRWVDDEEQAIYQAQVLTEPVEKTSSMQMEVRLLQRRDSIGIIDLQKRAILYVDTACRAGYAEPLRAGDILLVRTAVRRPVPADAYSFDYGRHLRLNGIVGTGYVQSGGWTRVGHRPLRGLMARAAGWRNRIERHLAYLPLRERSVLQALVLGDRSLLTDDVREAFAAAGAMHVLAVSGLHVGLLAAILLWLVRLGGWYRPLYEQKGLRIVQAGVVVGALVFYALLTGLSASVVRSVVMFSLLLIGRLLRPQQDHYNIIAASAFCILVVSPLTLFQSGFLLSYSAVLVIVRFSPWLNQLWRPKRKVVKYVYGLMGVSLLAQLGTLPWTIGFFGRVSNWFMLTNIGVLPWVQWLIIPTFLLYLCTCRIPVVSVWTGLLLQWESVTMNDFVAWVQALPGSTTEVTLSFWPMLCLVMLVASLLLHGRKRLIAASVMLCLFATALGYDYRRAAMETDMVVYQRGGETAVMAREGMAALVLTSDSVFALEQTHSYRLARHVNQLTIESLDTTKQYIGFRWHDQPYALRKKKNGKYQFISAL